MAFLFQYRILYFCHTKMGDRMDKKIQYFLLAALFVIVQAVRTEVLRADEHEHTGSIFVWEEQNEENRL